MKWQDVLDATPIQEYCPPHFSFPHSPLSCPSMSDFSPLFVFSGYSPPSGSFAKLRGGIHSSYALFSSQSRFLFFFFLSLTSVLWEGEKRKKGRGEKRKKKPQKEKFLIITPPHKGNMSYNFFFVLVLFLFSSPPSLLFFFFGGCECLFFVCGCMREFGVCIVPATTTTTHSAQLSCGCGLYFSLFFPVSGSQKWCCAWCSFFARSKVMQHGKKKRRKKETFLLLDVSCYLFPPSLFF